MRYFVRQIIKGGRCATLNHYYESATSDNVFNITSQNLDVQGNICEIIDKNFENTKKIRKTFETEFE